MRVLPDLEALDLAGGDGVGVGDVEQRAAVVVEGPAHPGERAAAGAAGEADQHGLGLVVAGVPEQHQPRRRSSRGAARARRSARPGRPPPGRARAPRPWPGRLTVSSTPIAGELGDDARRPARRSPPGGRGRRWRRRRTSPARGPRRPWPTRARASRRRRCTPRPAGRPGRGRRAPGVRRDARPRRTGAGSSSASGQPCRTRATQASGSWISAQGRQVLRRWPRRR